jgi:hypothetical protein
VSYCLLRRCSRRKGRSYSGEPVPVAGGRGTCIPQCCMVWERIRRQEDNETEEISTVISYGNESGRERGEGGRKRGQ